MNFAFEVERQGTSTRHEVVRKQADNWPFRTKDPVTELNDIREQYPSGYDDAYAEGHELSNFFDRNGDPIVMHTKRYQVLGRPGTSYVVIGIQTRHSNTSLSGSDGGLILSEDGQSADSVSRGRVGGEFNLIPAKTASSKKESSMDRNDLNKRESDILAAMANANLQERRQLAEELNDVRRRKRAAIQQDRDVDLADTVIRDTLTPVMAHSRSTEDTDWLGEVGLTTETARDDVHRQMTAEATVWFRNLHEAVIADTEEFAEQAKGKARAVASGYDLIREEAVQAFLDQASHLHRKAEVDWDGSTGQGAADVAGTPTPGQEVADYPQPDTSSNTDDDFGDDDADKTGPDAKESQRKRAGVDDECPNCDWSGWAGPSGKCPWCGSQVEVGTLDLDDEGSKESAKTAGEEVEWSGELPDCDICKTEFTSSKPNKAQFDAKTAMGPWAYMCPTHFRSLGVGLGTGQGQKLVKKEGEMKPPSDDLVDTDIDRYYGNPDGIEGPSPDSQSGYAETMAPEDVDEEPAFDDASFDEDPPKEHANQASSPPPGESSRGNAFQPSYSQRKTAARPLYEIAQDIEREWDNVNFAAKPYLDAMKSLDSINDKFMYDDAKSIVLYFLSNASSFRGERAKELKAELKEMAKNAAKTAAEGDTCAVCGDSIARDQSNENPSTWHHDNGEKHDHEAKPSDSSKESGLQVTDPERFKAFARNLRESQSQ